MESLNLNILANSLPPPNLAKAEKDLTDNFKAAALSLTTLYRSSKRTSKRAYNVGYAAACQDLLVMIQQGVSAGESSDSAGQGVTIGRIMDYIEARLEAIKSREEEEDEDDEKERERERTKPGTGPSTTSTVATKSASLVAAAKPPAAPAPASTSSDVPAKASDSVRVPPSQFPVCANNIPVQTAVAPQTPYTPSTLPTPLLTPSSPSPPAQPLQRSTKSRLANAKDPALIASAASHFDAPSTAVLPPIGISLDLDPPAYPDVAVGSKRRHNVMMLDSPPTPTTTESGPSTRRRTRSARGSALGLTHQQSHPQGLYLQDQNTSMVLDAMEVEEEGRERKRVARR